MYDDEIFESDGLSLQAAFYAFREEHSLWSEYQTLKSNPMLPTRGAYLARVRSKFIVGNNVRASNEHLDHGVTLFERVAEIGKIFRSVFKGKLISGDYIAFGRNNNILEPYSLIPSRAWNNGLRLNYRKSILVIDKNTDRKLVDIRVFEKEIAPRQTDVRSQQTSMLEQSKNVSASEYAGMPIDQCIGDHFNNCNSDFQKVVEEVETKKWLGERIAKKYNRAFSSVERVLRDKTKSPLHNGEM